MVRDVGIMAQTQNTASRMRRKPESTMKLKRGTFSATFFLACLAATEFEGVVLEEI
jgi:hypothetical protein